MRRLSVGSLTSGPGLRFLPENRVTFAPGSLLLSLLPVLDPLAVGLLPESNSETGVFGPAFARIPTYSHPAGRPEPGLSSPRGTSRTRVIPPSGRPEPGLFHLGTTRIRWIPLYARAKKEDKDSLVTTRARRRRTRKDSLVIPAGRRKDQERQPGYTRGKEESWVNSGLRVGGSGPGCTASYPAWYRTLLYTHRAPPWVHQSRYCCPAPLLYTGPPARTLTRANPDVDRTVSYRRVCYRRGRLRTIL